MNVRTGSYEHYTLHQEVLVKLEGKYCGGFNSG